MFGSNPYGGAYYGQAQGAGGIVAVIVKACVTIALRAAVAVTMTNRVAAETTVEMREC